MDEELYNQKDSDFIGLKDFAKMQENPNLV